MVVRRPRREAPFVGRSRNWPRQRRVRVNPAPIHIEEYRLDPAKWPNGTGRGCKRRRCGSSKHKTRSVRITVDNVLGKNKAEMTCLVCKQFVEDCGGEACHVQWRRGPARRLRKSVEIRSTFTPMGHGAYIRPGCQVDKNKYLGEYLGELLPIGSDLESLYTFEIAGVARVDAGRYGNLTRFFNHSCDHNVAALVEMVGGRQIVVFRAITDINGNEQILADYGCSIFQGQRAEVRLWGGEVSV